MQCCKSHLDSKQKKKNFMEDSHTNAVAEDICHTTAENADLFIGVLKKDYELIKFSHPDY